jgi:DNA-binding XRE family transcriptional regulator
MPNMDAREIGNRIRKLRNQSTLTQEALADFVGKTGRWLSEVENGRTIPNVEDISRLAHGLRTAPAVVLCLAPAPVQGQPSIPSDRPSSNEGSHGDVNRRNLLKAGAALALTPALAGLSDYQAADSESVLDGLETITTLYAHQSRLVPPTLLIGPAQGHLQTFRRYLGNTVFSTRRMYSMTGEAAVLVGRLAQHLNDWGESHQALSWAEWLARESGDGALMGHALGAMSGLHSGIPKRWPGRESREGDCYP